MTDEDMIARLREALTMIDVGEGWAAQIARAALAYSAPQPSALDDKIGPDAVAKAAMDAFLPFTPADIAGHLTVLKDDQRVIWGSWLDAAIRGVRAIGEASHDRD